MPIILWGSRGISSHLNEGTFYCPACERQCQYSLDQVREWFTLYFIPLFPIGSAHRYVECRRCGQTFIEDVLNSGPPTEGERRMAHLYRDLEEGKSLEEVESELQTEGLDRDRARQIASDLGGNDVWACQTCGQHYLKAVRSCRRCKPA